MSVRMVMTTAAPPRVTPLKIKVRASVVLRFPLRVTSTLLMPIEEGPNSPPAETELHGPRPEAPNTWLSTCKQVPTCGGAMKKPVG